MMVSARYNMLVHDIYSSYVMLISMHVVGPVQCTVLLLHVRV